MSYESDVNSIIKEAREYWVVLQYEEVYKTICEYSEDLCAWWCVPWIWYFIWEDKSYKKDLH